MAEENAKQGIAPKAETVEPQGGKVNWETNGTPIQEARPEKADSNVIEYIGKSLGAKAKKP
jgi:hypothetical protein